MPLPSSDRRIFRHVHNLLFLKDFICGMAVADQQGAVVSEGKETAMTDNTNTMAPGGKQGGRYQGMLYPTMLIAAIAVILFSVVGIATMTGLMPSALSRHEPQQAVEPARNAPAQPAAQPAQRSSAQTPARQRVATTAAAPCIDCGVVESIRVVESAAPATGLGAVAGGVLGGIVGNQVGGGRGRTAMTVVGAGAGAYAGHEVEKNMNRSVSYQIRVRMDDGTYRTFHERAQPALSVGQKVRVTDGRLVAAG
jgi:outer membrane lipoprotein SlyB